MKGRGGGNLLHWYFGAKKIWYAAKKETGKGYKAKGKASLTLGSVLATMVTLAVPRWAIRLLARLLAVSLVVTGLAVRSVVKVLAVREVFKVRPGRSLVGGPPLVLGRIVPTKLNAKVTRLVGSVGGGTASFPLSFARRAVPGTKVRLNCERNLFFSLFFEGEIPDRKDSDEIGG